MNSHTEENYLKALHQLGKASGSVSVNDLSKTLGIKMPTVTSMMKKLADKLLVEYAPYKPLRLTTKGRKEAALIIRKHRLTEMFLVQLMGFGWEEVHQIAEQVEHIDAPRFFERIDEMLGHPNFDPHGSPIPDKAGVIREHKLTRLSEYGRGADVILAAVDGTGVDFLEFLNGKNLRLGTRLTIQKIEPFDGTMSLRNSHTRKSVALSFAVCQRLYVRAVD